MPKTATRTHRLMEAHERLTQAVESMATGEDWKRMLQVASKFHRYSLNNILLISLGRPDATLVAGYRRWPELGRHVRKGEKGIGILAPLKYKRTIEKDNGEEETLMSLRGFKVVYVWDYSQTDGEPIEDLDAVRPKLLDADAPEGIWDALVGHASSIGYEVIRDRQGSENGYCDFLDKTIAVRPDVAPTQAVKTLIHELAHALLHSEEVPLSKEVAEVEVESVAFIVCDAIGLDSGDYSFAYVARWAEGSTDLLKETGERVIACAKRIVTCLELPTSP